MKKILIIMLCLGSLSLITMAFKFPAIPMQEYSQVEAVSIPFKQTSGLIFVKARINGKKENFILDTGAPALILNSAHFEEGEEAETLKGVSGQISTSIIEVEKFDWEGIAAEDFEVRSMDLSHLEAATGRAFAGLIGYDLVKDYELLIDYEKSEMLLFKEGKSEYHEKIQPADEISFEYMAHIPSLSCKIGKEKFMLGLDTGAANNLVNQDSYSKIEESQISILGSDELRGANKEVSEVVSFSVADFSISEQAYGNMTFVKADISHLQGEDEHIDGLIGYPVLSQQKTSINFPKQKMYFWN
ncbi:MAG: pepsin/retropepsin-like aspartic protease family protein [Bacteroidota bacterium]